MSFRPAWMMLAAGAFVVAVGCEESSRLAGLQQKLMDVAADRDKKAAELVECQERGRDAEFRLNDVTTMHEDLRTRAGVMESRLASYQDRVVTAEEEAAELRRERDLLQAKLDARISELFREPWRTVASWNLVRRGMTESEVVEILGHPQLKTRYTDTDQLDWHYPDKNGGWVRFDRAGPDLQVSEVQPPPWDLWRQSGAFVPTN